MNKKFKNNKQPPAQKFAPKAAPAPASPTPTPTPTPTPEDLGQKEKLSLEALGRVFPASPKPTPPEDLRRIAADPQDAARFAAKLDDLSVLSQRLSTRIEEEERKRSELEARKHELEARKHELDGEKKRQETTAKEQAAERARLVDWDRGLKIREAEAENGFARKNEEALSGFQKNLADLQRQKTEASQELAAMQETARLADQKRSEELIQRETDVAEGEVFLHQDQVRLTAERERLRLRNQELDEEAEKLAEDRVARLEDQIEALKENLQEAHGELTEREEALRDLEDLRSLLAGRSPQDLRREMRADKERIRELESQVGQERGVELEAENDILRQERDQNRSRMIETHRELEAAKSRIHALNLGVSDQARLEAEKRLLESHVDLLEARSKDLRATVDELTASQAEQNTFPHMAWMDSASSNDWIKERRSHELERPLSEVGDLKAFAADLRHRIALAEGKERPLYFALEDIRLLVAGLAMSQLHILQGVSGTGKTSLVKAFAKAVGGACADVAVQAGWRDRDDLLGHYNAFEKRFYERDCLQGIYRAQTAPYEDRCNLILLDEMNLSRPEQYFAELLSALEKNAPKDRLVSLTEIKPPQAPKLLREDRKILIPPNLWFMGTANHDETTNEFADKTYDRAHVMTLPRQEDEFKIKPLDPAAYSFASLRRRFDEAVAKHEKEARDLLQALKASRVADALRERFDLGWGNRFERQALNFIPVFIAAGGRAEAALDHLLASRVLRRGKVVGRYDATLNDLSEMNDALADFWRARGAEDPKRSLTLLGDDIRRKGQGS